MEPATKVEVNHAETLAYPAPGTVLESKDSGVHDRVLVPQPTNDPNDPLNWSTFEKYSTHLTVCFFTTLATMNASNFTVAISPLSKEFHQSPTRTGYLVCFNVLLLGVGNAIWIPLMRVFGKRPVYLLALTLLIATNVWSFKTHSFNSLLAARILSGLASSAGDATVPSLVADMFFIHERGHCMMIFHLALSAGYFLGPLICAYITEGVGWRWTCGLIAISAGATLLVGIFTIRESSYRRETADVSLPASAYPPKASLLSWMSLTRGYRSDVSFFRVFFRTLSLAAYPPVAWSGLIIGVFVGWNIVVQLTSSHTFTKPPYGWPVGGLGLLSISGFIGAVIAFFLGGKLIDIIATRMTDANNGRREPEFRLPAIIIPAVIGPMGVLTFGLCVAHYTTWVGAAFGYGMQGFGLTAVSNIAVTYAVDSYHLLAGESLVVVFVIRNTIATILALYTINWQEASGIQNTFGEMVGIQYFFLLIVIPLYFYGKQIRAWTGRFGAMAELAHEV
ncbi:hypothetical protein PV08_11039 [Exophiala spinifera]|uniref:Major facilitator superfamily (MFS) profile domain-containing protein n=1 Tax=Exophiala spinifera TaxID=91928 RepID=A0A0D2BFG9_9EURO|nr:uncharacterized protein PV08_11039 [Exophiala spinifera]KIW10079.1 hypothetical protein PV08_11039 [Exophiala spinifera]